MRWPTSAPAIWARGTGSAGSVLKAGFPSARVSRVTRRECSCRVAAADQDHAVGQGEGKAVAEGRWQLADLFPSGVRGGEIEGEKAFVPDLLAAVPGHRAVGEIRPAASDQVIAVDSGEGTGEADGIGHRRQRPDHRRLRVERAGGGKGGGGGERSGKGG
jgi:hypothetical protein